MSGSLVLLIILLISSLPVIVVYAWFRIAKYKFSSVRFLFALLSGTAAFFPALILQKFLIFTFPTGGRFELFYHIFFRIAFTEELSRLLILSVFFFISNYFAKRVQANQTSGDSDIRLTLNDIRRATATGLVAGFGFAILENAVYAASDTGALILRAVTAAPLHAACGSRVGSASVMFRTNPIQAFMRLLTATVIHGIYNFMAAIPGFPVIMAVLIAFTALASSIIFIRGGWEKSQDSP